MERVLANVAVIYRYTLAICFLTGSIFVALYLGVGFCVKKVGFLPFDFF